MDPIAELRQELRDVKRQLSGMHRLAKVTAVDAETARLTVEAEGIQQKNVPFFTMRAGEDQTYWLPSVGEMGYLVAICGIEANSVFLPGIFFNGFPAGDKSLHKAKRIFRDGTVEEIDTESSHYQLSVGAEGLTERLADTEKVQDSYDDNTIKIDGDETLINRPEGSVKIDADETVITRGKNKVKVDNAEILLERALGLIKEAVGSNSIELNTILANIVGAHIFPTGITTFQTAMGPVFFAPASSPPSAPAPPATAAPVDGKATKVPPSTVQNVGIPKGTFIFTIPPLPVTGTAGTVPVVGTTVATPATLQVTATGVTLAIPGKAL